MIIAIRRHVARYYAAYLGLAHGESPHGHQWLGMTIHVVADKDGQPSVPADEWTSEK